LGSVALRQFVRTSAAAVFMALATSCVPTVTVSGDLSREQASDDLAYLGRTLVEAHPNAFFKQSRRAYESLVRTERDTLPGRVDDKELFLRAARIAASIGDAHTQVAPYIRAYDRWRAAKGTVLPFEVRSIGTRFVVAADFRRKDKLPNGAALLIINGRPIDTIVSNISHFVSGEQESLKRSFIAEDFRVWLFIEGIYSPFHIRYLTPEGRMRETIVEGVTIDQIHFWDQTQTGRQALSDFNFRFLPGNVGDLELHTFSDKANFRAFFRRSFHELAKTHAHDLIIDLRENSGGSTEVGDLLLSYITDKPFRQLSRIETRVSAVTKKALGHDKYVWVYGERAWNTADGNLISWHIGPESHKSPPDQFNGRTFVLIGPGTFSSAAIFAASTQDAKIARILGRESGGLPTLYGETFYFDLPNSGLEASVATKYLVRPNGDESPHGVVPDVQLGSSLQLGPDPELQSAVRLVRSAL